MRINFNECLQKTREIGFVDKAVSSLAYLQGLPGVTPEEVVVFESGELGHVTALTESRAEVLSFSRNQIKVGTRAVRADRVLEIPVGEELLGATIDSLGRSLNPQKPLPPLTEMRSVETLPLDVRFRSRIKKPCETGVSLVDLLIPLGKGQRELVIGDQKTGKSRFLLRSLLTQVRQGSVGIYAVIGKSQIAVKQLEESLQQMGIFKNVVLVVSTSNDSAGMIYLTPYTAMTIAEYFRDAGRDTFVVFDDMSVHAKIYREISLLGMRYPGRNSYPGDIFYIHSRLLERAGNFLGSGGNETAITCLPVVETVHGDLTGYIQTNIMSMTDGHIFFDHNLFTEGRRPAIDPFLSVTRVGLQTQSSLRLEMGRALMSFLRNAERIHKFTSFGTELGEHVKKVLDKEERVSEFLDQTAYDSIPSSIQALLFGLVWNDELWEKKTRNDIRIAIQKIIFKCETQEYARKRVEEAILQCSSLDSLIIKANTLDILGENAG